MTAHSNRLFPELIYYYVYSAVLIDLCAIGRYP